MRCFILIVFITLAIYTRSQSLGGSSVFNFLRVPHTPQLTALGGVNVSTSSRDVGMAFYNPALLTSQMHTQVNTVFNHFYAGISAYHLSFAYHQKKLNTNFSGGLLYLNYGNITQTDASGNITGTLNPIDWVMQWSASRSYLQHWDYGLSVKFIQSAYGMYRSNGIATDAGVLYRDTSNLLSVSVLVKNMGFQLKKYSGTLPEDLPFDLQAGITKGLKNAPLSFSFTIQRMHRFDIRYNDAGFDDGDNTGHKKFTFDKLFRHFILAAELRPVPVIQLSLGYNHLRRQELNIGQSGNGLNGFSAGIGFISNKLQVRYARSHYQNNTAFHQLGLNLTLNEYFGLGKFGERIGW